MRVPVAQLIGFFVLGLLGAVLVVLGEVRMLEVAADARAREAAELKDELRAIDGRGPGQPAPPAVRAKRQKLLAAAEAARVRAAGRRDRAQAVRGHLPRLTLAFGPALGLLLACFHPGVLLWLRSLSSRRLAGVAAGVALWFSMVGASGFFGAGFNAYVPAILACAAGASAVALKGEVAGRISAAGLAVWLLLWIPFDLRWMNDLWLGVAEMEYAGFSLLVSLCGVLAFAVGGRLEATGVRPPRLGDLVPTGIFLLVIGVVVVPLGLALGFLGFTPPATDALGALLVFGGLALTVALPEELFFRGILDAGLQKHFGKRWVSLAVSSLAFGLMHWNNRTGLESQLKYVLLATVAGAFYGLAFRKTRGLAAPVLVHTLVDLAWQVFLRG